MVWFAVILQDIDIKERTDFMDKAVKPYALWAFLSVCLLVSGLYYYLFRYAGIPGDPSAGTFPSFIFVLSFTVLARLTSTAHNTLGRELQSGAWLFVALVFEPLLGTFDVGDVAAALAGYVVALPLSRAIDRNKPRIRVGKTFHLLTLASGLFFIIGSDDFCADGECDHSADPVYMSYAALRSAVELTDPRPIRAGGNFVLYGDYLLINERNQGIHVIDNRDPAVPKAVAFITVPGNTSLVVRNDIIFADSFVDLVALATSDMKTLDEVSRQQDIFPYDPYQAIDDDVVLGSWDTEKGVVIGYD
ncbi:MAG TPA: hypothetical protein DD979_10250 [Gammaproteobacteria bacterium]|nr:hypothetical protein [Gammaproteobacteria bacterium]